MEWNQEHKIALINKIKLFPVLWQPDHASYGKRGPRDLAYRKVEKDFPGRG
jgi:hypothetical protein